MTKSHSGSLLAYAWHLGHTWASSARMLGVAMNGATLEIGDRSGKRRAVVVMPFDPVLESPSEVHARLVGMHKIAAAPRLGRLLHPLAIFATLLTLTINLVAFMPNVLLHLPVSPGTLWLVAIGTDVVHALEGVVAFHAA
eukprot:UC1_evm2s1782